MMGFAIGTGQFFTGHNFPQGIKLDMMPDDPHIGIGTATVIDIFNRPFGIKGIQGIAIIQFHEGHPLVLRRQFASCPYTDDLPLEFTDLPARGNELPGKGSPAIDPAGVDLKLIPDLHDGKILLIII